MGIWVGSLRLIGIITCFGNSYKAFSADRTEPKSDLPIYIPPLATTRQNKSELTGVVNGNDESPTSSPDRGLIDCLPASWRNDFVHSKLLSKLRIVPIFRQLVAQGQLQSRAMGNSPDGSYQANAAGHGRGFNELEDINCVNTRIRLSICDKLVYCFPYCSVAAKVSGSPPPPFCSFTSLMRSVSTFNISPSRYNKLTNS